MTATTTVGRVGARDLAAALRPATALKARFVQLHPDAVVFGHDRTTARVPFAGRGFDGDPIWLNRPAFARVVRACRGDVLIERADTGITLTTGQLSAHIPTAVDDDGAIPSLSELPSDDGDPLLTVDARRLARAVLRAAPFATCDATRPVLVTVALDPRGHVVATDSYRLAALDLPDIQHDGDVPLPLRLHGMLAVATAMGTAGGDVRIFDRDDRLDFAFGDQLWTVGMEPRYTPRENDPRGRTYPDYRALLPDDDDYTVRVELDAGELAETASLIADVSRRNEPLVCTVKPQEMEVVSRDTADVQVARTFNGVVWCREAQVEIGLNPEFLHDIAAAIAPEGVVLELISPLRPARFTGGDGTFLLMPIRLNV